MNNHNDIIKLNKLHELIMPWVSSCPKNIVLTGLKSDSRDIILGDLFIAIFGSNTDGRLYINHAIKNGAIAILSEYCNNTYAVDWTSFVQSVPVIYIDKLKRYVSSISGRFYGYPSLFLKLVGVTGTNGKTTITHLLSNWIELIGEKSAIIGTLGYGVLNNIYPSACTTCAAIDTQRILAEFVHDKIKFVAMEISSHGLDQYRVDALYFNVAIFSNLSYDHLDYHKNIKKYEAAKWKLFNKLHVEHYVINVDDDVGFKWILRLPKDSVAVTTEKKISSSWMGKWIYLVKADFYIYGTDIFFNSSWGSGMIHSKLLGMFNVSNVLLALGALLIMGYPLGWLLQTASKLVPVCGRMEVFQLPNYPTVIIDYAHTPDALEKVLIFVKKICNSKNGRLWCIFGCGGDRDRNKRLLMGVVAAQYSNYIIVTNDNPRTENPQTIINDIVLGIKYSKNLKIIQDRAYAIETAILSAESKDFVLIFGKGHEKYQIIGKNYINYSDQHIVQNLLYK